VAAPRHRAGERVDAAHARHVAAVDGTGSDADGLAGTGPGGAATGHPPGPGPAAEAHGATDHSTDVRTTGDDHPADLRTTGDDHPTADVRPGRTHLRPEPGRRQPDRRRGASLTISCRRFDQVEPEARTSGGAADLCGPLLRLAGVVASGGAAHRAGPPLTPQGRLRRRSAIAARPLTREPLRPLRAAQQGQARGLPFGRAAPPKAVPRA
jgi:hypothetical protein